MTRMLIALVMAVALAACQQPAGSTHPSAAGAEDDALAKAFDTAEADNLKTYKPSPWFKARLKDATLKMMDRLMTKCLDSSDKEAVAACFHERMLVGFDRDGTVKRHCPQRADANEDLSCILFGGMGYEVASKLGPGAVTAFDWSNPERATHNALRELALRQVRDCLSGGSASDIFDCYVERITKILDINNTDLDPCTEFKDDDVEFGNCVGEVYGYKYMTAGVERM